MKLTDYLYQLYELSQTHDTILITDINSNELLRLLDNGKGFIVYEEDDEYIVLYDEKDKETLEPKYKNVTVKTTECLKDNTIFLNYIMDGMTCKPIYEINEYLEYDDFKQTN